MGGAYTQYVIDSCVWLGYQRMKGFNGCCNETAAKRKKSEVSRVRIIYQDELAY